MFLEFVSAITNFSVVLNNPILARWSEFIAIMPILLFPLPLCHYSKAFLHANSRDEEGDVHQWLHIQSIAWHAPCNAFFFYLCEFSRFFVLDSAWRNKVYFNFFKIFQRGSVSSSSFFSSVVSEVYTIFPSDSSSASS